jgi:hypothetical protein
MISKPIESAPKVKRSNDMINGMMNCGWGMMAGGLVIFAVLGLAGAALVKYLFFANRGISAAT